MESDAKISHEQRVEELLKIWLGKGQPSASPKPLTVERLRSSLRSDALQAVPVALRLSRCGT